MSPLLAGTGWRRHQPRAPGSLRTLESSFCVSFCLAHRGHVGFSKLPLALVGDSSWESRGAVWFVAVHAFHLSLGSRAGQCRCPSGAGRGNANRWDVCWGWHGELKAGKPLLPGWSNCASLQGWRSVLEEEG